MDDKTLLSLATEFDAGPPVVFNGVLVQSSESIKPHHHYRICKCGTNAWKITDGEWVLNKETMDWEYEPLPSERLDAFIEQTRFGSVRRAFEFLEKYKAKVKQKFAEQLTTLHEKEGEPMD